MARSPSTPESLARSIAAVRQEAASLAPNSSLTQALAHAEDEEPPSVSTMNITLDQFIDDFERSVAELPAVLEEWPEIDADLQETYAEQLAWMLSVRGEIMARAADEERGAEIAQRLSTAAAKLYSMRALCESLMGIRPKQIVRGAELTETNADAGFNAAVLAA